MSRLWCGAAIASPWWAALGGYGPARGVFSAWSTSWPCRRPSRPPPGPARRPRWWRQARCGRARAGHSGAGRRSRTPSPRPRPGGQLVGARHGGLGGAGHELLDGLGPGAHAVDDRLLALADAVEHLPLELLGGLLFSWHGM